MFPGREDGTFVKRMEMFEKKLNEFQKYEEEKRQRNNEIVA